MTVSTIYEPVIYEGDGSTSIFPITFNYLGVVNNVKVSIKNEITGIYTVKSYGTHYTISGSNVTFTSGNKPKDGELVILELYLNLLQESDYVENGRMSAETLEDDLDKLTLEVQMLADSVERTVRVGPDIDIDTLTPTEILEDTYNISTPGTANQVLTTDGSGNLNWATVSGGSTGPISPSQLPITTGTWTPSFWPSSGSLGEVVYNEELTEGAWIKMGPFVWFTLRIATDSVPISYTATGDWCIDGLPFTFAPGWEPIFICNTKYELGNTNERPRSGVGIADLYDGNKIVLCGRQTTSSYDYKLDVATDICVGIGNIGYNEIAMTGSYYTLE